jgi:hypothetical protein
VAEAVVVVQVTVAEQEILHQFHHHKATQVVKENQVLLKVVAEAVALQLLVQTEILMVAVTAELVQQTQLQVQV